VTVDARRRVARVGTAGTHRGAEAPRPRSAKHQSFGVDADGELVTWLKTFGGRLFKIIGRPRRPVPSGVHIVS